MLARRVLPVHQERMKRLEQLEVASEGRPLPAQALLRAFLEPFVAMRVETGSDRAPLGKLMAWLWIERDLYPRPPALFEDVIARFAAAACQGRDDLKPGEAAERLDHAMGATSLLMHRSDRDASTSTEARLDRLISFLAAGLETPGHWHPGAGR